MAKIVVGVDGSPGSKRALDWALAEARQRATTLEVVHTYSSPETIYPYSYVELREAAPDAEKRVQAGAERLVDDMLTAADIDGVTIERVVEARRHPARVLVDRAQDGTDLLVVGSRGRGGFTGLLLGSVGQQVTHHTHCPVVVVPPER
jgi:nucleotide-binding universal stress UspA family protein